MTSDMSATGPDPADARPDPVDEPNIILTGFMGAGKSTVGRLLAERLGRPFVDTDALIEGETGRAIVDIIRVDGEPAFRALERAVARRLAARRGLVIATGGGLMLDPDNRAALEANGVVFCLVATPGAIARRLGGDVTSRPLLQGQDPIERIHALLESRAAAYAQFTPIDTTERTPTAVVEAIFDALPAALRAHATGRP